MSRFDAVLLLALLAAAPSAATERDRAARADFMRQTPCPATGERRGPCPGFVVDHIVPLCAGGLDGPGNMQWQDEATGKDKDRRERQLCRLWTFPANP